MLKKLLASMIIALVALAVINVQVNADDNTENVQCTVYTNGEFKKRMEGPAPSPTDVTVQGIVLVTLNGETNFYIQALEEGFGNEIFHCKASEVPEDVYFVKEGDHIRIWSLENLEIKYIEFLAS